MSSLKILTGETPAAAAPPRRGLDLAAVRERLRGARGPAFWRGLEELADSEEFRDLLRREFPRQAAELFEGRDDGGIHRRHFLQLAGASLALAGLTACTRQPAEKIVPYVKQPEQIVPGKPLYYATAMSLGGYAAGLLAESHMGRPTKVEGNPEHPASLGATDLFAQASVLTLYDPDRSQAVTHLGRFSTWNSLITALEGPLEAQRALEGAGLRILTETVTSPGVAARVGKLRQSFPRLTWHRWEAAGRDEVRRAARRAFGEAVEARYDLSRAEVILSLDSDLLTRGPGAIRYAHDFAAARRVRRGERESMSRLYAVESTPTLTGTQADHRLALPAAGIRRFALALAARLGVAGAAPVELADPAAAWLEPLARDLAAHRGRSLIVAGDHLPAGIHVLVHALNDVLGNAGSTVLYSDAVEAEPVDHVESLKELVAAMDAGEVDLLVILGANPVFTAPADLDFAAAMKKVELRVHLGLYHDETAEYCTWHVPEAHYLESWGDARAYDGTVTFTQPLIEPLHEGKSALELLAALGGESATGGRDLLREHWRGELGGTDGEFEAAWRRALHDGLLADSALPPRPRTPAAGAVAEALAALGETAGPAGGEGGLELHFRPDPTVWDGRFANNGWLQEVPKPLTKLTWDNAVLLSPATAERLGVATEDVVEVQCRGRAVSGPVWVLPGQADGVVTVHLGYGRSRAGRVGADAGFDAYALRASDAPWVAPEASLRPTGGHYPLASTQLHGNLAPETEAAEDRHLIRSASLARYLEHPEIFHEMEHGEAELSLYPGFEYEGHAWGLAVDLTACTGCNACVVACQAENNIPVVGKDQVLLGREMHWIRVDRYYEGDLDDPAAHHQPVMCMHCEQAPCEVVCPVAATVHSDEGLNDMVYNRCVGTRYCSNNCPYKVRRFNFLKYNDTDSPLLAMARNPDVTVRFRGVMEKCTYCVQRINHARIEARTAGRDIADGEIRTACQQACPSRAIVFGDLNDPDSEVRRWKAEPLDYGLLTDLGTRPRTTYLAKLRNPNPELEKA